MTRFVILAAPRTGSNLLCTLLASHGDILCHHELFNPNGVFCARDRAVDFGFGDVAERDRNPKEFLDRVWRYPAREACVGFKWTRDQDRTVLSRVVSDEGVKKIVLRRRHRLKTFLSECIARELDQWEVYDPRDLASARPRLTIHGSDAIEHAQSNATFYRSLDAALSRQPKLELWYEELFEREVQRRLLQFLEVSPDDVTLRPGSVKQNSDDVRQLVANFEELRLQLQGTELEGELAS